MVCDKIRCKVKSISKHFVRAIQQSTKWYRENSQLKRKSAVLVQRVLELNPNASIDMVDTFSGVSSGGDDDDATTSSSTSSSALDDAHMEDMKRTIQELSENVARIQTELNAAKLQEFEAMEQTINLTQELEMEREKRKQAEMELEKLKTEHEHMNRVSKLVTAEVVNLRDSALRDRENVVILRNAADNARKERNILAHQSALLMDEIIPADGDDKFLRLLQEVDRLKSTLEDERIKHSEEIATLQDKLDDHEMVAQLEVVEEKLKLVESDLEVAMARAEVAEQECQQLKQRAAAPPPPPPPPPLPLFTQCDSAIKLKTFNSPAVSTKAIVQNMEQLLGINGGNMKKPAGLPPGAAINDVINQIKGGRFTLKATADKLEAQKKTPEEPAAVREMLNVLGTLRRRQKPTPQLRNMGDVQL